MLYPPKGPYPKYLSKSALQKEETTPILQAGHRDMVIEGGHHPEAELRMLLTEVGRYGVRTVVRSTVPPSKVDTHMQFYSTLYG